MNSNRMRAAVMGGTAVLTTAALAAPAFATDPTSASDVVTTGAPALKTALLAVAGIAVIPGVTILAVRKGWRLAKGFF